MILTGIGGQGIITLATLIGNAAVLEGYEVRMSEVHGMAQRGGHVVCHLRFGSSIYSPLVMEGMADLLVSLELSEVLRVLQYLKPNGTVIINNYKAPPPLAVIKGVKYPSIEEVLVELLKVTSKVYTINAQEIARNLGTLNVMNTVVLGAVWATQELGISKESLIKAITMRFGEKWKDINVKAFEAGANALIKGQGINHA